MSETHSYLKALLKNLRTVRQKASISERTLEERLVLGPGWIKRFESGDTVPSIDMLLALLHEMGSSLDEVLKGLPAPEAMAVERTIFAEKSNDGIIVHFRYADHDAEYRLLDGSLEQFESVVKTLRDGLARLVGKENEGNSAVKTDAVAKAFLHGMKIWPSANPSDIWGFLIQRAYCDPYNHPAQFARLSFEQSWKRTSGWALEEILVRHYGSYLKSCGVNIYIGDKAEKRQIIQKVSLVNRIEEDKIDVLLTGDTNAGPKFFGVVHVKASFAERRTDDVPLSEVLSHAGYTSPLWTMDCKSGPGTHPVNWGELGDVDGRKSAKRKDIEDEGYFTGCFSYNTRTNPSGKNLAADKRVYVCDFSNPNDVFSQFIIARWEAFQKR